MARRKILIVIIIMHPLKKPSQHIPFKWQIENAIVFKYIPKDIRNALLG